ncbi:MAG: hypothetical protein AAFR16_09205 [Pseudomonadota bacterium]
MTAAKPSIGRLRTLWRASIAAGAAAFALALLWAYAETDFDWIWWVMAFGVGAVAYNAAFAALCAIWAPSIAGFVLEEDTEVRGDDVVHVVRHSETGDEGYDFYIRAYAAARGAAIAALSMAVLIAVALIFFT